MVQFIYTLASKSSILALNKLASSSVWVFIAQLGEHCSANAEATGLNPV